MSLYSKTIIRYTTNQRRTFVIGRGHKERGDIKNRVIGIKERVVGLGRQNSAWTMIYVFKPN